MISAVVAMSKNGVIGNSGELPWYLPADLRHFKELTVGHSVIMGRTTFDSIFTRLGRPLPERQNIVVTRNPDFDADDVTIVYSLEEAVAESNDAQPIIIGGAQIYALASDLIDRWYVTEIDTDMDGDVKLEGFDKDQFIETAREDHLADEKNPYNYSFVTYDRR